MLPYNFRNDILLFFSSVNYKPDDCRLLLIYEIEKQNEEIVILFSSSPSSMRPSIDYFLFLLFGFIVCGPALFCVRMKQQTKHERKLKICKFDMQIFYYRLFHRLNFQFHSIFEIDSHSNDYFGWNKETSHVCRTNK